MCCQAPLLPILPILPDGSFPRAGQVSSPACAELLRTRGAHRTDLGVLPWGLSPVQDSAVNSSRLVLPRLLSPSPQLSDSARLHAGCPAPCSGNSPRDSAETTTGLPPWYALSQGSLPFAAQCPSLENLCFSLSSFFVFLSSFRCFVCVCILCFCGVCRLLQVEGQIQSLLLHLGQEQKMC